MNDLETLVDFYGSEWELLRYRCNLMEKMLDLDRIRECLQHYNCEKIYVYGGGFLGIQFYRTVKEFVKIAAVVDKSGKLRLNDTTIPVIDFETFRRGYRNEMVIITPITFYGEIRKELLAFVPEQKIVALGEFLEKF